MDVSELSELAPLSILSSPDPVNQGMALQTGALPVTELIWIYNNTAAFPKEALAPWLCGFLLLFHKYIFFRPWVSLLVHF